MDDIINGVVIFLPPPPPPHDHTLPHPSHYTTIVTTPMDPHYTHTLPYLTTLSDSTLSSLTTLHTLPSLTTLTHSHTSLHSVTPHSYPSLHSTRSHFSPVHLLTHPVHSLASNVIVSWDDDKQYVLRHV